MKPNLRICLIAREYPPDTGWGGIATFTRHLAHGLRELGHDVEVISSTEGAPRIQDDGGIIVHRVEALNSLPGDLGTLYYVATNARHIILRNMALWQKFLDIHRRRPFDVIDTPELLGEGMLAAVTHAAPLVVRLYTPHFKFIEENLHNVSATFDHECLALFERLSITSADAVTSPSDDLAEYVAKDLNLEPGSIKIIRNPIDTAVFCPEGPKAFESNGTASVLFVGRLEERKGIQYLVEAIPQIIKTCGPVRFTIIGSDTDTLTGYSSMLEAIKKSLQLSDCLKYVNFISRVGLDELPSYYRSADICVVPSVYDNSPYTCLEAMSCGRAVVGTTGGGMPEYMGSDGAGVLVPPRDAPALVDAIAGLLKDPSRREQLGINARARVLACFTRTEIARQTAELYSEAIQEFAMANGPRLYLGAPDNFAQDSEILMYSFTRTLGEFVRQRSMREKYCYWSNMVLRRPGLFAAKACAKVAHTVLRLCGAKTAPGWLSKLGDSIELREHPVHGFVSKAAGEG